MRKIMQEKSPFIFSKPIVLLTKSIGFALQDDRFCNAKA